MNKDFFEGKDFHKLLEDKVKAIDFEVLAEEMVSINIKAMIDIFKVADKFQVDRNAAVLLFFLTSFEEALDPAFDFNKFKIEEMEEELKGLENESKE